jgi:hypothetical protein
MGALTHLPHASPETITETTPGATVPWPPVQSCSVTRTAVTPLDVVRLDLGRDRGQGQVLARE